MLDAANECLSQKNFAMACQHWLRILPSLDHMYPYLGDIRRIVRTLIRQYNCENGSG